MRLGDWDVNKLVGLRPVRHSLGEGGCADAHYCLILRAPTRFRSCKDPRKSKTNLFQGAAQHGPTNFFGARYADNTCQRYEDMNTAKTAQSHAKPAKFHAIAGFTHVELAVVIIIIAVLVSMLPPAIAPKTHGGPRITCINHLKQLGTAYRIWANDNGDRFPAQTSVTNNGWSELAASTNAASFLLDQLFPDVQ